MILFILAARRRSHLGVRRRPLDFWGRSFRSSQVVVVQGIRVAGCRREGTFGAVRG